MNSERRSRWGSLLVLACLPAIAWSGFHLGMPGAVKKKVRELDQKILRKAILDGTAASGRPLAAAIVTARGVDGKSASATAGADGTFTIDVTELKFPLLLRAMKGTTVYFSATDQAGTVNIHPYTDLVLRTYFRTARGVTDAATAFDGGSASVLPPSGSALAPLKGAITSIITPVLARQAIDAGTYDMFTARFDANGTGFDRALDETQVSASASFSTTTIRDTVANVVLSTITSAAFDNSVPAAPTNVSTTSVTRSSVTLQWALSVSTNVAGYAVFRDGARVGASTATTFTDRNLSPGSIYGYEIEAFTWAGTSSARTPRKEGATLASLTIAKVGIGTGTVTSSPAGVNCGAACALELPAGQQVVLTAVADALSAFSGWSGGGCSGTLPCTVTLAGAIAVTAAFNGTFVVTVSTAGTGGGTITSAPAGLSCTTRCSARFEKDSQVALTAIGNTGFTLLGWSGACSGRTACLVAVTGDTSASATFGTGFPLAVTIAGGPGTIASSPPGISSSTTPNFAGTFAPDIQVALTAVASDGYYFTGWSGGGCSGTQPCTVTMSQAQATTANFAPLRPLTVTKVLIGTGADGTVTSSPAGINLPLSSAAGSGYFLPNAQVTLTAAPKTGCVFAGWGGACAPSGQPVMSSSHTCTATFSVPPPTFTPQCTAASPCACTLGAACNLTLVGAATGGQPAYTYSLQSGSASPPQGTSVGATGDLSGTVNAAAAAGTYTFGVTITDQLGLNSSRDAVVVVSGLALTVSKSGSGSGTVTSVDTKINCGSTCSAQYASGASVTLAAAAASGSTFLGWTGGDCAGTGGCEVTMSAAKAVTAVFGLFVPGQWAIETVDAVGDVGSWPSIAADATGIVHVSYRDVDNAVLKYARNAGSGWSFTTLGSIERPSGGVVKGINSLALDGGGNPHVVWHRPDEAYYYRRWTGTVWTAAQAVPTQNWPPWAYLGQNSLAVQSNGTAHVTFSDSTGSGCPRFSYWNTTLGASQTVEETCTDLTSVGDLNAVGVDGSGGVHKVYSSENDGTCVLKYVGPSIQNTIGEVNCLSNTNTISTPRVSMAMDAQGKPHVTYVNNSDYRYAKLVGSSWVAAPVIAATPPSSLTEFLSLALSADGTPHVVFVGSSWSIRYATYNGSAWTIETVDQAADAGQCSIALDGAGGVHIAYASYEGTGTRKLKYAKR